MDNPNDILHSEEEVAQKRAEAAKQQQQIQQMAAMQHTAQTANIGAQAAQTLSQTQIGGGADALSQILGTGGGTR